jgi:DNA-directed RNA polymerase specialized sigma24 family protein
VAPPGAAARTTVATVPERAADPSAGVEERLALQEALRKLPPGKRAVLVLRYLEDLPEAQVADILGCSVGTVRSQTHRAIVQLRSSLAPGDLTPVDLTPVDLTKDLTIAEAQS